MPKINDGYKYSGTSFETGIIFRKTKDNIEYLSVAARAKDGEISTTSKIVEHNKPINPNILEKIRYAIFPARAGMNFKLAVLEALKKNNGKFDGAVHFALNADSAVGKMVGYFVLIIIFVLLPWLLVSVMPVNSAFHIGMAESFAAPLLLLFFLFGSFALFNRNNHFAKFHGAEHKAVKCYLDGNPLTLVNIKKYNRDDVRCGTSFVTTLLFFAAVMCSVFFYFVPIEGIFMRMSVRVAGLPVAYALVYAIFKLTVNSDNKIIQIILNVLCAPGLLLQRKVNAKEPDDDQLEVAIAGMSALLLMK